ncbi:MAG: GMC family oxidoreductase N-terminal domain-containing protein [Pseudomonadota bacterium]
MHEDNGDWDYIIVGAGTAGCVLANRLSADPKARVLLLEAGGHDRGLSLHIPAGLVSAIFDRRYNWMYPAVSDPSRHELDYTWSGGKGLGGSSSINGMLFMRGAASDYDQWEALGCPGWGFSSMLPHFRSLEAFEGGANAYRGDCGPQVVSFARKPPKLVDQVIEAAQACGHPFNADYNGESLDGVSSAQATIKNGRRHSAASAFLKPAKGRQNLEILTHVQATRLVLRNKKAVGVEYSRAGKSRTARCRGEVIVSGGAIGSPRLLMLSGIGDPEELGELGINVVVPIPAVGKNLMEHPGVYVGATTDAATFNRAARWYNKPQVLLRWLLFGSGPASMGTALAQVLFRSQDQVPAPDLQLLLTLATFEMRKDGSGIRVSHEDAFAMACCVLQPKARGRVFLASADPLEPCVIDHRLLGEEQDIDHLVQAASEAIKILRSSKLKGVVKEITFPVSKDSPRDEWIDHLRSAAFRGDHPCGTCRMGSDPSAVVDPQLRVVGIEGLRVVDASIMPVIPSGNTNAPVMAIAEKAASMLTSQY